MNLSQQIARNTVIQTLGKVVSIALGWGIILLMTNALGASGFGEYTIITAYLQFFGVALDFGMVLVAAQLFAEHPNDEQKIFANLFSFRLITAFAVLLLAPILIWLFPYSLVVKQGVLVLVLSFFLSALMQIYTGFNQRALTMGRVVIGELLSRVVLMAVIFWAVISGRGLTAILLGVVIGAVANFLFLAVAGKKRVRLALAYDPVIWREIWQRAWPLMITIVLNLIYLKTDTLILSFTRSSAEVGVYGAVYRIFEVLVTFPTMFAGLLLPVMTAARVRGDKEGVQRLATRGLELLVYVSVAMVIVVWFVAEPIVALFGKEFVGEGARLLRWLVVANAAVFIGTYLAHLLVMANQQKKTIWAVALTASVGLASYLVFIPIYGAIAAAILTVIVETLYLGLMYFLVRRHVGIQVNLHTPFGWALLASVPLVIVLNFVPWWYVGVPIALLLYVVALFTLGAVPRDSLTLLFSRSSDER